MVAVQACGRSLALHLQQHHTVLVRRATICQSPRCAEGCMTCFCLCICNDFRTFSLTRRTHPLQEHTGLHSVCRAGSRSPGICTTTATYQLTLQAAGHICHVADATGGWARPMVNKRCCLSCASHRQSVKHHNTICSLGQRPSHTRGRGAELLEGICRMLFNGGNVRCA